MDKEEIPFLSAVELAELIEGRGVSPVKACLGITVGMIAVVGMLLTVACGGSAVTSPKSSSWPPANTKEEIAGTIAGVDPDFELTSIQLHTEYIALWASKTQKPWRGEGKGIPTDADEKYNGKVLLITGAIKDVTADEVGGSIWLEGVNGWVQCSFSEREFFRLPTVSKGDYITLKGRGGGWIPGTQWLFAVLVRDCAVAPPAASTPNPKETSVFFGMPVNQITLNSDDCRYAFARAREYVNVEWDLDDGNYVFMKLTYNDNFWNENRKLSQGALQAVLVQYQDRIMEACSSNGRRNR